MDPIERTLRDYINSTFFYEDGDYRSDVGLIPQGKVDSTGFLEIVTFVEDRFGFAVVVPKHGLRTPDADLTEENWGGVDATVAYIKRRIASGTATGMPL